MRLASAALPLPRFGGGGNPAASAGHHPRCLQPLPWPSPSTTARTRRGNHDSLTKCGQPAASAGRALLARVYRHYFGGAAKLYSSVNLGPWKVVSLNSMLGGLCAGGPERGAVVDKWVAGWLDD